MTQNVRQRIGMAGFGLLAGASLYLVSEIIEQSWLSDRLSLALAVFASVFFAAAIGMVGPLRPGRAALSAAALGVIVALLLTWAGLRFVTLNGLTNAPIPAFAVLVLSMLPLPFLMALAGPGWSDYSALFNHAWGLVVRFSLVLVFVGVVWGVILLSNALFGLIGLTVIDDLLAIPIMPWLITGCVFGVTFAVINELNDYISPFLILRLMRLLVLPVLVVFVVFMAALPVRGLSGLFGGFSSAATLLAMTAAAIALVSASVDQSDADAVQAGLMARVVQALALVLPVPAGLAAWAVWLRVAQYGWTPERLFVAWMVAMGLGYAWLYAAAILVGADWRGHIRRANTVLAVVLIGTAALWLTPILNPEAISARSQMARFEAGGDIDFWALADWGTAGAAVRTRLELLAKQPGQEALAARLQQEGTVAAADEDLDAVRASLLIAMPLQPATATATRDALLAAAPRYLLTTWSDDCAIKMANGAPACVLVIADLWTGIPGNEAIFITTDSMGSVMYTGLSLTVDGVQQHPVTAPKGNLLDQTAGQALLSALQGAAPVVAPAPINLLRIGETDLLMTP